METVRNIKGIITIVVIGCLLLAVSSCHKYPEDPFISLRNPRNRIKNRNWYLTSYYVNGIDSTNKFQKNGFDMPYVKFAYTRSDDYWRSSPTCDQGSAWDIGADNYLYIGKDVGYAPAPNCIGQLFVTSDWQIKRLYGKKLKITTNYKNKYYELSFEAQ